MKSANFVLYLTCLFLGEIAQATDHQKRSFLSATVGGRLTLPCFYEHDDSKRIYWYKQTLGEKPKLMSTFYVYNKNGTFHDEFNKNPRFTLETDNGKNHLVITDLCTSDSGTYYCAKRVLLDIEFADGTTVSVQGSGLNTLAVVHQSSSETFQPGGSVSLNCTVHNGTCDGEHSVYWFKDSEESHPGLIYTQGNGTDQCRRNPSTTSTQTCVYNLPMKNLNLSHAGTYYCAVASCGRILFGNGTKLDFEDDEDSLVLVYFLTGALTFTTFLCVLLALAICAIHRRNATCPDSHARLPTPSATNAENDQTEENLHYAALREHQVNRPRRQRRDTETECVYSRINL